MKVHSPIIVVDDDPDDLELVEAAHAELKVPNPLIQLTSPSALIGYMKLAVEPPFLILSDYNLPTMNGLQLREHLVADKDNRFKSIPFLLWSTGADSMRVKEAFDHVIQGFFVKPASFDSLVETYKAILTYWQLSMHPKPVA